VKDGRATQRSPPEGRHAEQLQPHGDQQLGTHPAHVRSVREVAGGLVLRHAEHGLADPAHQRTGAGYQWSASGKLPANPVSQSGCAASFSYNSDFQLNPDLHDPSGDKLWITDAPNIPLPSKQKSSVGVTLGGSPACVTDAGPNLGQTFTLHPTYYINSGSYVQGQMVDGSSVTAFQQLAYTGGNTALTATLNPDNTWTVQNSKAINFAELFAARPEHAQLAAG
jgi:hypothetical protein